AIVVALFASRVAVQTWTDWQSRYSCEDLSEPGPLAVRTDKCDRRHSLRILFPIAVLRLLRGQICWPPRPETGWFSPLRMILGAALTNTCHSEPPSAAERGHGAEPNQAVYS